MSTPIKPDAPLRPAAFCRQSLAALDVSDSRRRRRKRNTTPDALGMSIKRDLLESAAREDPEDFEAWLLGRCLAAGASAGPVRAMALSVLEEWRMAQSSPDFREWLQEGAPSDDAGQE